MAVRFVLNNTPRASSKRGGCLIFLLSMSFVVIKRVALFLYNVI